METEEYLKQCEKIEEGLHRLADDLYRSLENPDTDFRDKIVEAATEKVRLFDELYPMLDDEEKKEVESIDRYIKRLRRNIEKAKHLKLT